MTEKQKIALTLKEQLRKSAGRLMPTKDFKLNCHYNAGFGYWFPEHIRLTGEHRDYYSEEFAECAAFLINNLEELVETADARTCSPHVKK